MKNFLSSQIIITSFFNFSWQNPKNFQTAASLLPIGLVNSGKGIMGSDHINENRTQQASHPVKQDFHEKQVVFATEFEQNFYKTLITSKSDTRYEFLSYNSGKGITGPILNIGRLIVVIVCFSCQP